MRSLHRPDLYSWSVFDEARNVDFNGVLWTRIEGNIAFDPMPQCAHDRAHLKELGPLAWVVITNSDHMRDAIELARDTGARIAAPAAEKSALQALGVDRWLSDGDELVPGLQIIALNGSKTPGELACRIGDTLITGDLVRAHRAGSLMILPDPKLADRTQAVASVRRLAELDVDAVLVGDGWPIFRDGQARLKELAAALA